MWNLYHLTFEEGIEYERAFVIDLSTDTIDRSSELFSLLHRKSIIHGGIEDYWIKRIALSPKSIARALFYEDTLAFIRREIKRLDGINVDIEDLGLAIQSFLSPEAREQIGPFKIRKKRNPSKGPKGTNQMVAPIAEAEATTSKMHSQIQT